VRIRDDEGLADPEFSMAPMIDVVFQLLIFFMLATTYQKSERQLDVDLPSAESGVKSTSVSQEILVDILRDGRVFVGGREVERASLVAALSAAASGRDKTPVTVRGDRNTTHEVVVAVLDACGLAGLSNLSIGTLDGTREHSR
jgi:biopolymer transport protein ExbD